jgi:hypothetical protein
VKSWSDGQFRVKSVTAHQSYLFLTSFTLVVWDTDLIEETVQLAYARVDLLC